MRRMAAPLAIGVLVFGALVWSFGSRGTLTVPPGFRIEVFAEGLDGVRTLRTAPDGMLYAVLSGEGRIVHLFASATTLPVSEHRADPTTCTAPGQARCISCSLSGGDTRIERMRLSSCGRSRLLCWCCSRDPAVDPEIIFRDSLISVKTEGVISIS